MVDTVKSHNQEEKEVVVRTWKIYKWNQNENNIQDRMAKLHFALCSMLA